MRSPRIWLVLALSLAGSPFVHAEVTPERERAFSQDIVPLMKKYCLDCHSGDDAEKGAKLDGATTSRQVLEGRTVWTKALTQLRAGNMPPKDAEKPTKDERQRMIEWLDKTLNDLDCGQPAYPGHVTIRRLNRAEYRNTIRDLFGVDYLPARDFPADDVGYGFDNIGDVMTLPTILLEKYLAAAEEISSQAIVTNFEPTVVYQRPASQLRGDGNKVGDFEGPRILVSSGEMTGRLRLNKAGDYELRIRAYEHHAGNESAKMAVKLDGKEVAVVDVTGTEGSPGTYKVKGHVESGDHRFSLSFVNDYYQPDDPNPKNRDRNLVIEFVEAVGPLDIEKQLPESHQKIFFVKPGGELSVDDASRKIIERLASRLFRRPATPDELTRLSQLAQQARAAGDSFEQSISLVMQATLVSPHFLFRVEPDPTAGKPWRQLNEFELATRLSYFLWSSTPDEELLQLAWRGELSKADNLDKQVRRMLDSPKSQALVENFASQWLQLRKFDEVAVSRKHFPSFTPQLRGDMRQETLLFFGGLVKENRSIIDLLDADYSYLNERLAKHYGVPNVRGEEFRRVSLQGTDRKGVLSQGSVLTVTSNPSRTSPVKRGKWILENILGEPPPIPPPNVPVFQEQEGDKATGSLKQRLEQHRLDPNCSVCHLRMDSLGFALENFDAVGAWRTKDGKFPIEPDGELPSGEKFRGPKELTKLLLDTKRDDFVRCLTEKMLIYALGRGIEYYDQCAVDKIKQALEKDNFRAGTLILEIVRSEPFQRQGAKRMQ